MKTFLEFIDQTQPELMQIVQSYLDRQDITPEEGHELKQHIQSGHISNPRTLDNVLTRVLWLESRMLTVYRGTGPLGIKELRPSEEGVHGPGIYFYDNLESARVYAEPGGGVVVAQVDLDNPQIRSIERPVYVVGTNFLIRTERIIVVPDASLVQVVKVIPTDQT